jgi:hypothetical protein
MDVLESKELTDLIDNSKLIKKYNEVIDRESAYEMLNEKIEIAEREEVKEKAKKEKEAASQSSSRSSRSRRSSRSLQSTLVKTLTSPTVIRSVLGILGKMMR